MSRSGSAKKFEFLRPFIKVTEKTEKSCFALDQFYIELKMKFVYNNQQCLASQTLTTSCRIFTSIPQSFIKYLGLYEPHGSLEQIYWCAGIADLALGPNVQL